MQIGSKLITNLSEFRNDYNNENNHDEDDDNSSSSILLQQNQPLRKLNCPTCHKEFPSRNSLHNHLATHNSNDLKMFVCELCNNSFKTKKDLSKHAALHEFTKHKTCKECGMTFKTSFHLKRHSLTRHTNLRPFNCIHCHMNFARKDKLKQHEAKHINHPLYQCIQCNKGFYRKEHLKDHEISKHSKAYPFTCENCNKGFVHAKDLHRHIRVRHLGFNSNINSTNNYEQNSSNNTYDKNENLKSNKDKDVNFLNSNVITQLTNNNNNNKTSNIIMNSPQLVKQGITKKPNRKNAPVVQTTLNQQPQQQLHQQITPAIPITQPPQQIISASSNDFKSKKISSILKSGIYLNNNVNTIPNTLFKQPNFQNNPTTIYTQTLQLNPVQLTLDNNNLNSTSQLSIPIYNRNSINDQFVNSFSSNNVSSTQNINLAEYSNQSNFSYNNTNIGINYNGIALKQVQEKQKYLNDSPKKSNLVKANKKQNESFTVTDQASQSQTGSIDNTIDSILSKISSNVNTNSNQSQQTSSSSNQFKKSFKCEHCAKDFFYENHLRKHILSKHTQTPLFSCSVCQQGFSTKATAKSHVENSHSLYMCPVCYKSFNNRSHALRHINNIHQKNNNDSSVSNAQNLTPLKQDKSDAKIIDLSSTNINILNTIEIKQKQNNDNKFSDDNNNNNNNNSSTTSVNLNLNDINLGFVEPQSFSNSYWTTGSAASTSSFPSSTSFNIGILQQQQPNGNQLYEHSKSDNAILVVSNSGQNPYYLSQ